jgi:hypothetical protein
MSSAYANSRQSLTATIANGATISDAQAIYAQTVCGIITPATLTGTALSFQVSQDGVTYYPLYDSTNTLMSVTVGASRAYTFDPAAFNPWNFVKVVSNATEGGSRAFVLAVRMI